MGTERVDTKEKQQIAALAAAGKSQRAIGRATGRDKKTVARVLNEPDVIVTRGEIEAQLADLFAETAHNALKKISDEKLEKSTARDLGILAGVCIDKHRIITGQSTQNIAVIMATAAVEAGKMWERKADNNEAECSD